MQHPRFSPVKEGQQCAEPSVNPAATHPGSAVHSDWGVGDAVGDTLGAGEGNTVGLVLGCEDVGLSEGASVLSQHS